MFPYLNGLRSRFAKRFLKRLILLENSKKKTEEPEPEPFSEESEACRTGP